MEEKGRKRERGPDEVRVDGAGNIAPQMRRERRERAPMWQAKRKRRPAGPRKMGGWEERPLEGRNWGGWPRAVGDEGPGREGGGLASRVIFRPSKAMVQGAIGTKGSWELSHHASPKSRSQSTDRPPRPHDRVRRSQGESFRWNLGQPRNVNATTDSPRRSPHRARRQGGAEG